MERDSFDCIVIGGGINGTGIARDCAMRGIKVLLLEKNDFSSGATGACSGMIHGGVRYLIYEMDTTKRSCLDSGYIQRIAPFLLFRIPFLIPVPENRTGAKIYIELLEAFFRAYDWFVPLKRGKKHTRLNSFETLKVEPGIRKDIIGAITMDEWGIDPFRLCTLNILSAKKYGAVIKNHCEVKDIIIDNGKVRGVRYIDLLEGKKHTVFANIVVNAGGPWLSRISKLAGCNVMIRPGKGVHLIFERRLTNYGIITSAVDGRQVFLMPHDNTTIIGTTDDDYYGDPDVLYATRDEVEYLLQAIENIFPTIRLNRIIRAMVGIRCTLYKYGINEDKLSRAHKIYDGKESGADGFYTMAGGKLASYRLMSEEIGDIISKRIFNRIIPSRTHIEALPGGDGLVDFNDVSEEYKIPMYYLKRMFRKYGTNIEKILAMGKENPSLLKPVCLCEPVLEAEVRYAIREEFARTIVDIRRRTRLGTGACQGMRCGERASHILAEELKLTPEERIERLKEFRQERWKGRAPILSYGSLKQEEIHRYLTPELL